MKLLKYMFPLFILLTTTSFARIYVVNDQQSGIHFLCYSLIKIFDKPILLNPLEEKSALLIKTKPFQQIEDAMWFGHHPGGLALHEVDQSKNFLIIILRDYHEHMASMVAQRGRKISIDKNQALSTLFQMRKLNSIDNPLSFTGLDYINILRCYDEWDPSTRILIHYEDLVDNFESTMKNCLKKLNISTPNLERFLGNFSDEREVPKVYTFKHGKTISGEDAQYYQKSFLGRDVSKQMDSFMKKNYSYFWWKYLHRYEVKW